MPANPDAAPPDRMKKALSSWLQRVEVNPKADAITDVVFDDDEVPLGARTLVLDTFRRNCEQVFAADDIPGDPDFVRVLKRSFEQHDRRMDGALESPWEPATPKRTWDTIKEVYRSIYEAAGSKIDGIAYQKGFPFLYDLVEKAEFAAHYPDHAEDKLRALLLTLKTQQNLTFAVYNLTRAASAACGRLDHLQELARNVHKQPFEQTAAFSEWLSERDDVFAQLNELLQDPVLKHHLPYNAEFLDPLLERISIPEIPTIFHPVLEAKRHRSDFSPEMEEVAAIYSRALADVHHADLIPNSAAHFSDLETAIESAIGASAGNPQQLGSLYSLQAQIAISTGRRETARAGIDDLTEVSTQLTNLQAWASSNRQPIHRAPEFAAWRERADEVLDRCQRMRTDFRLSGHFQRTGVSDDTVATALALLRDSRFQKPPSPQEIAAQRQARAETREESVSMSV